MHPRVLAQRQAIAEERIAAAVQKLLAEREGEAIPSPLSARDPHIRALFRLEQVATVLDRLAYGGETANATEKGRLRARLLESVPAVTEENVDAVLVEIDKTDADEPLSRRLQGIEGIGARSAVHIQAEVERNP
jgi:hypothetical protein